MTKPRWAAAAAVSLLVPALVATSGASAETDNHVVDNSPTYTVTITNNTDGQYLTPPNWAAHDSAVSVFRRNQPASSGVQAVAENGGVPVLAAELTGAVDAAGLGVSGVGADAPIGPGQQAEFTFRSDEAKFTVVSMLICTNDGFAGLNSQTLPRRDGQTKTFGLRAYDAGTEVNTELHSDTPPAPFCGNAETGTGMTNPALAENGVVRLHETIQGVGDFGPTFDWDRRAPVAEVSVTRSDATPVYRVTIENTTDGQYMTPPNVAIHDRSVRVFRSGHPASAGVQAVAENGAVPDLAAELQAVIDDAGLGASTVGGGPEGPLAPGLSRSFLISGDGDRLSLVSMLICTNDGFAGIDGNSFHLAPGQSRTWPVTAYDAGTEINTESGTDTPPAPFCGNADIGTGETNPALAENGVIQRHRTIQGIGDFGPAFDWKGSVANLTIERL